MADLVSGGLVGVAFAELFTAVKEAVNTARMFKSRFKSLCTILESLEPYIKDMKSANLKLDRPKDELQRIDDMMKEGKTLVESCMKVKKLQFWKKYTYSKELLELYNDITNFYQIIMMSIIARDVKENRVEVRDITMQMYSLSVQQERGGKIEVKTTSQFEILAVPSAPGFVVGLDRSFDTMKKKLLHGEEHVLVVSAPGGCGKTTLVKKLCHDRDVKDKYKENILFVVLSQSPNLMAIIQQIIHHKRKHVPEIHTEDDAVCHLQQLLSEIGKENPILLVLDDIWSGSESILEKFVFKEILSYKILVTSRYDFPAFGPSHQLNGLDHEDAVKLLCHAATPQGGFYTLPKTDIIDQVVRRCKGSPLALTVVGKSLCGKDLPAWRKLLLEWSDGVSLIGTDESKSPILKCLINSLKDLEGLEDLAVLKKCFLDLGSFPEDHKIPVAALIDMWSELHKIDANGVDAIAHLKELTARSLADFIVTRKDISEGDGYFNDMYITQHDLLRELAIQQNSQEPVEQRERLHLDIRKNRFPNWLLKDQKQPFSARLLSICTDEMFSSAWPDMELPAVEVLVLNFRATTSYTLPDFIKKMVNLKTLIIANNGFYPVELSNFALLGFLPNLKRIRLERIKVPFLRVPGVCLNNLEKVSLFNCNISQEIMASEVQIHEAFPNLEEIDISYCSDLDRLPVGICNVASLKKISITNCHNLSTLPAEIGKLLHLQVLRLNSCTELSRLPDSIVELEELSFLDLSNCASIHRLPNQFGQLSNLKELHITGCLSLSALPSSVSRLLEIEYFICDKERYNLWRHFKNPKLKVKVAEEDNSLGFLSR